MSRFDFMNFEGGIDTEFVVNANKFTKFEAIARCLIENEHRFEGKNSLRTPIGDDVEERRVKYYVRCPEWCGFDADGMGCYTYSEADARGSFPVWVIDFSKLRSQILFNADS